MVFDEHFLMVLLFGDQSFDRRGKAEAAEGTETPSHSRLQHVETAEST